MDPLTIFATITGVLQTAQYAKDTIAMLTRCVRDVRDARNGSSSVSALIAEIEGLANACELIGTGLEGIKDQYDTVPRPERIGISPQQRELSVRLEEQVDNCKEALESLQKATHKTGQSQSIVSQVWQQFKLNMKEDRILAMRERIRGHVLGLQLILQMLNIKVSHMASDRLGQNLTAQNNALHDAIIEICRQMRGLGHNALHGNNAGLAMVAQTFLPDEVPSVELNGSDSAPVGDTQPAQVQDDDSNWWDQASLPSPHSSSPRQGHYNPWSAFVPSEDQNPRVAPSTSINLEPSSASEDHSPQVVPSASIEPFASVPSEGPSPQEVLFTPGSSIPRTPNTAIRRKPVGQTPHSPGGVSSPAIRRRRWLRNLGLDAEGALQRALMQGRINEAMEMISSGTEDAPSSAGLLALHLASLFGDVEVVNQLVQRGTPLSKYCKIESVESRTSIQVPALHLAVIGQQVGTVKALLNEGVHPLAADSLGRAAPAYTIYPPWSEKHDLRNPEGIIEAFVSCGWDINSALTGNEENLSLLHHCFLVRHLEEAVRHAAVRCLIDHGASVLQRGPHGLIPLHLAAICHDLPKIVNTLLKQSRDKQVRAQDSRGWTALFMAVHVCEPSVGYSYCWCHHPESRMERLTYPHQSPLHFFRPKSDRALEQPATIPGMRNKDHISQGTVRALMEKGSDPIHRSHQGYIAFFFARPADRPFLPSNLQPAQY